MDSELVPGVVYLEMDRDITEHDLDIISDLWTMDGREVYRGTRDPRYTHANVYWLYSETLERVGLTEHSLSDQADFRVLWFRETEFGTVLQEDGWERGEDIWSSLPRHVVDRCINEGWTTPEPFLEQCLDGPLRILTPMMIRALPMVHTCTACGRRSLKSTAGCTTRAEPLTIPTTEKLFFVDTDMIVYRPPPTSRVWDRLTQAQTPSSGDSQAPVEPQPQGLGGSAPPAEAETPPPQPGHPPQGEPRPL
jgi:hypothetical protein